ncbi:autotransporter assembly complex family protein [Marinovum sp. 2_MG-2023]|uniref:autotransporter assembly complex protein TamA n=2 Tax=Roseobacteraceae TaxID=2854170 RepID=UPI0026E14DC6|nr:MULTISPECIES: autotransporter assembly complex family protein [unclassified Marinovum]MDO6732411.1 autotransporter assembly complex family protein [Marinovum sp. 2_MG-2023]MDO6781756.1 autotransporter assembly complex family protein [Marinovum sp. 1_MG-2023]
MVMRRFGKSWVLGALAVLVPGMSLALDQVDLQLVGSDNADLTKSLNSASVLTTLEKSPETLPRDVVAAAQADYAKLVEALYAQGYYSAVVNIQIDGREAATIDPFRLPAAVGNVVITVQPGRAFRLGQVQIAPLAGEDPPVPGFARDEPALATVVRDAAQGAVRDWREAGHAKAEITGQSIEARHASARLDVDVRIAPGPRLRFGDTSVDGTSTVRDARVRQIAGLPKGEVFTPKAVDKAASRLRRTGTFQSVQVEEAETPGADGQLDMEITVVDRKPRRIGGGIEYSTFGGLTLSGFWLHRNLFGGAERFRIEGEISQLGLQTEGIEEGIDYELSFRLEKPAVYGPDTLFYAEAGLALLDEPDYLEKKSELAFGVSQEFNDFLTGELGIGLGYSEVTDRFANPETIRELLLVSLPGALTYDRRDNTLNTTSGYYLRGEVTPFVETLAGDTGAHMTFDGRGFVGLGAENRAVAAARLQLGALVGPDAVDAPPGMLFYSGGGGTVRGQPYQSLDADYDGVSLGGRAFASLSAEMRFSVTDTIGLVAFADAGFIGHDGFDAGNSHAGAGLGLRYNTPVGPIRLDVAAPVAGETGDGVQVYIGIGQAF